MKKSNILIIFLAVLIISGCSSPKYLPPAEDVGTAPHGAYIFVDRNSGPIVAGELIAVDSMKLYVWVGPGNKKYYENPIAVSRDDIYYFSLHYARNPHYGWTIPLFTAATISHGWLLILTAPINLIATIAVTVAGESAYQYNNKDIPWEDLRMFARFPQGIPPGFIRKMKI